MSSIDIYSAISAPQSKTCYKCKFNKSLTYFSKDKRSKDNYQGICKSCVKDCQNANKEPKQEYDKQYRQDNKECIKNYQKEYNKEYNKINKAGHSARSAKRRAVKLLATPKWIEIKLIEQLYIDRELISEMTNIKHHVDHIVPLQSDLVCGLHCMANLQIISATENHSKSNSYWPDMPL